MFEQFTEQNQRACGRRVAAGIYAETRLSPFGEQVDSFILCPPKTIDIEAWGLVPRGASLIEIEGVWHIFDIVSKADYRVADYVEETRKKGASRRLSIKLNFTKLSQGSRLVLIHAQAIIENYNTYPQPPFVCCPLDIHLAPLDEMCAGLWWHDFHADELQGEAEDTQHKRRLPGGISYFAYPRPANLRPVYRHGIFMSLPVTNLTVISGRNHQEQARAEQAFQAASLGSLPVFMEDE